MELYQIPFGQWFIRIGISLASIDMRNDPTSCLPSEEKAVYSAFQHYRNIIDACCS